MSGEVEVVPDDQPAEPVEEEQPTLVTEPAKLMRIAVMLRQVQEEARRAPTDEQGRERLRTIHERALSELCEAMSPDLREELERFHLPFDEGVPSESEMLIAQAQLIGWLEGLFHGIQAAMAHQQMQAMQNLQQLQAGRQPRGLPFGTPGEPTEDPNAPTGQYL